MDGDKKVLNLGCGFKKMIGAINVDAFDCCEPDIIQDLSLKPWAWAEDNSFDLIIAHHVFEHLINWWGAFEECGRILKVGGILEIKMPDESSSSALSYRDHYNVFTPFSFHGALNNKAEPFRHATNAWASLVSGKIPLKMNRWDRSPHGKYNWMLRFPRLLNFCADHLRNFIWEQTYTFEKVDYEQV